jgi:putative FmdB family regulatory protein
MARYEFRCEDCGKDYDEFASFDPEGQYPSVVCPYCQSSKKKRLMSAFSFNFSNPEGTDRWNSDTSGHDYRWNHNQPKVQQERQIAEQVSHMGNTDDFYNPIDDITSGEHFG